MEGSSERGISPVQVDDRRAFPRWQLFDTATLILETQFDVQCPLRNVSGSGLAAETSLHPMVGDEAVIYVRSLGRFAARVARVADDHVAFRFLLSDQRQMILLHRLEQRLISQAAHDEHPTGPADSPFAETRH
ncbi:PilZ domain-containing protein [Roseospira navarrensis]|nr:PilZ domain-containing protein [Roseospira navarrensis]